ncbi:MAG TPA: pyrroloquinoline quinone-dependent dehydrogenase [Candidatus Acidoferrum sp.]|nr:pyrroloquinoline quinone-dependent dehydrogenase [Candidatus Acidoferrum sp.]
MQTSLSFEPRPDCARHSANAVIRPQRHRNAALLAEITFVLTICAVLAWGTAYPQKTAPDDQWAYYGHDAGGMRFSPLTQINRENVASLKVAWTFHTGDLSEGGGRRKRSGFETTPLFVDGTLYLTTAFNRIIALDPETGTQRWAYDPKIDLDGDYGDGLINRGAATWLDPSRPASQPCHRRIFESTQDARLVALDAAAGVPCADFGKAGQVSLRDVLQYDPGWYHMTSPPAIIDDLVVVGSAIDDNHRVDMARGVVRAYDARTGELRWSWDPLPPNPTAAAAEGKAKSWRSGAGNAWSIMVVDPERDLIFVPTGSASPDYYGGLRPGDDKWSNSVVALRGKTGQLVWGFQLVHHDLWDFDCASPPLLATLHVDGKDVPVVIQGNKSGLLYVLNRDTGKPVFPVEERKVPQSDVPGEVSSATQPFPEKPPPLAPQTLSNDQAWGPTPEDRDWCRNYIARLRNEGVYTPPSLQGTLMVPGNLGGMTWSGYAYDPGRGVLVTNTNNLVAIARLIPREKYNDRSSRTEDGDYGDQLGAPYGLYRRFIQSPSDLPCSPPPWGFLTAVDMTQGKILWQVPLGSMQDFGGAHAQPIPPGSISLGGPIITASGLVFIGGATDCFVRGFDIETGKELWRAPLPACGNATPMTYRLASTGKQYLVIAAGGHPKITEEKLGDSLSAFTLPCDVPSPTGREARRSSLNQM